jgi:hypothetical protein
MRLLMFALLIGAAYLLVGETWIAGSAARVDGNSVEVETDDFRVEFSRGNSLSDSFMIFGGNQQNLTNRIDHVHLAGLPIRHARSIRSQYPDFHMCKSPGAKQAQSLTEDFSFVAATSSVKQTLMDVVDHHADNLRADGERTCVRVRGARLSLESIHLKENGMDITSDVRPTMASTRFFLAEEAELADCQVLLY